MTLWVIFLDTSNSQYDHTLPKTFAKVTFLLFSSISPLFLFPAFWWRWHLLLPLLGPEILTHPLTTLHENKPNQHCGTGPTRYNPLRWVSSQNTTNYLHKTCKTQYRSIRLKIPRRPRRYYTIPVDFPTFGYRRVNPQGQCSMEAHVNLIHLREGDFIPFHPVFWSLVLTNIEHIFT